MAYRPAQVYTGSTWDDIGDKRMLTHNHSGGANGTNIPQSSVTDLTSDLASKADVSVSLEAKTADYTLVLADAGKLVTVDSASAETVTIPLDSSVAFPVGTNVAVAALGAGVVTIEGASGVTVNSTAGTAPAISAQYAGAQCYKIATDEWLVIGSIA
jgi:hypothetical protein